VPCLVKSTSSDNINSPKGNGQQALVRLQEQLCLKSILTFRNFLLSCLQKAEKRQKHCATLFRTAATASHTLSHQKMEQPPFTLKRTRSAPREYGQITATGLHNQTNWKGTQHKMSATCWESRNCSCVRQQMVQQTCAVRESN